MSLPSASNMPTPTTPAASPVVANRPSSGSGFVDRRTMPESDEGRRSERRQFGSSHAELSEDGRELALAIDRYKIANHRRYLTCDEMLRVLAELGYRKQAN